MSGSNSSISAGLDAIFNISSAEEADNSENQAELSVIRVPISKLRCSKFQPRKKFDELNLRELAQSISSHGIIQPLIVREVGQDYEIIAGERRWRASKLANLNEVPVIIKAVPDESVLAFALIENIQREDLNVVEEAQAYSRLLHELKLSHEDIANKVGKSRSHITNILRILNLSDNILAFLKNESISMGHARALLALPESERDTVLHLIIEKQLSVRETERLIRKALSGNALESNQAYSHTLLDDAIISKWESSLREILSARVSVKLSSSGKGRVSFTVDSPDELKWLVERLTKL